MASSIIRNTPPRSLVIRSPPVSRAGITVQGSVARAGRAGRAWRAGRVATPRTLILNSPTSTRVGNVGRGGRDVGRGGRDGGQRGGSKRRR